MTRAAPGTAHWSGIAEIGSAFGIGFLFAIYRWFGRWPFRLLLVPVAGYFYSFKPEQRAASLQFLSRCHDRNPQAPTPGALSSFRHFLSFGEAMLDKLVAWNGGIGFADVDFQGYAEFQRALSQGRGALLIGSHLGNLEVCRVLSQARAGLKLRVLVHTRHAQNFNRLLERLSPSSSVSLMQVTDLGVAQAAELGAWVAEGGVVLIAGDRVPVPNSASPRGGRVCTAPFLGHPAPFPQGPFVLASVLGCPVFLMFCLRRGRRFEARLEPFGERLTLPRKGREATLDAWASRFSARLEHHALGAPLQWFNFFPFWSQEPAPKPADFAIAEAGKRGDTSSSQHEIGNS